MGNYLGKQTRSLRRHEPGTSTGVSKGVVMRLRRMASTGEQVLERGAVWGTLGELYHSYFLEILYNFGFPRGGLRCDPPWRSWFSPCPIGPKNFFWRRCAAARRFAPSACRTAMVSRPHSSHPQDGASSAHSSRARSAERVGAGAAQQTRDCASEPLCRPTGALLPLSPRRSSTPPAGRHNAVPQGTAVLTEQTKPSVPD